MQTLFPCGDKKEAHLELACTILKAEIVELHESWSRVMLVDCVLVVGFVSGKEDQAPGCPSICAVEQGKKGSFGMGTKT